MLRVFRYDTLATADLVVNAVYEGEAGSKLSGEPLSKLIPGIGNLGGFRPSGKGEVKKLVVLSTSGKDKDWPDRLDPRTGMFTYYGDNRKPGGDLHDTPRGGNRLLRDTFEWLHIGTFRRNYICPFFVFETHPTPDSARSYQFKGMAVPGYADMPETADLVAVWKTSGGQRFLNYKATFTILDAPRISRVWIEDLRDGKVPSVHAPSVWREWVETREYRPLIG